MSHVRPPRVLQVIDSLWPGGAERLMPVLVGELHRSGEAVPFVRVVGDGLIARGTGKRHRARLGRHGTHRSAARKI